MILTEWPFLVIAGSTVLALRSPVLAAWRIETLAAVSLVFVVIITIPIGDAVCLATMAATGWAAARLISRNRNRLLLILAVACVLAEFIVVRHVLPQAHPSSWLRFASTIGLSYMMFRVIHVIVDAHGDELPARLRLRDYLCFLFCYLTFLAGPIQRLQDFCEEMQRPVRGTLRDAIVSGAPVIITGYLKFTVLSGLCFACFAWSTAAPETVPAAFALAVAWLSFAAYLYASFSGYVDIVRGIGGLAGVELPPNFNQPFAAANFLDFWSRWHMSLSEWFKLYVFNPVVKEMILRSGKPALTPYLGAAGYFVTFVLMGLWHGISPRFALYGFCLGAGVSANKLYQTMMQRRLGRAGYSRLTRRPWYQAAARASALGFFVLALGFLWIGAVPQDGGALEQIAAAPNHLARDGAAGHAGDTLVHLSTQPTGAPMDWIIAAGLVMAVMMLLALAARKTGQFAARLPRLTLPVSVAFSAAQAVAVLAYLILSQGLVPPLLYAYF